VLEFCAGIPTIVYGVFTCIMVAPFFQDWGDTLGISISGESALVIGSVIGLMNLPFVVSLTDEILFSIPAYVRRAAWALGSTRGETICRLVLPAAFPGIMAVLLLAVARSLGETMIVLMAASLSTHMTLNPLTPVTTITAQIYALLTGDQSPENPKTQAVFALGLLLFTMTLGLNFLGSRFVRKYSKHSKGSNSLFGGGG
jgi:phosphate transport system permease protein